MRILLFISLFIISCKSDINKKAIVCIERVEYFEPTRKDMGGASLLLNIKVEDSILYTKIEKRQLKGLILYSIKKEDRGYLSYDILKEPLKESDGFSFVIWTSYFRQNITDVKNHKQREWNSNKIITALEGNIGLVFENDTVIATSCLNKKMIIQLIND